MSEFSPRPRDYDFRNGKDVWIRYVQRDLDLVALHEQMRDYHRNKLRAAKARVMRAMRALENHDAVQRKLGREIA